MKRSIISISLVAAGMLAFSSCGSDDMLLEEEVVVPGLEEGTRNSGENLEAKTYSQSTLELTYNGNALLGKTAEFSVVTPGEATIQLSGEALDLTQLIGDAAAGMPSVNTCGVFPGTPVYTLNVELTGSEDECSFKGNSETEYCTFSYEGTVDADNMSLNLYDVRLKDTTLADSSLSLSGTWGFKPFDYNFYNDLRVVWESEKGVELFEGFEMPVSTVVSLALAMEIVNGQSVAEILTGAVKDIQFLEDGNVVATYADASAGDFVLSPTNIAQYVVKGDKIMLYINPWAVIANEMEKGETRSDNVIMDAANSLFASILPMVADGIPLTYGKAISGVDMSTNEATYFDYPDMVSIYLDTEVLKPLLTAVAPLFADEDIKKAIIDAAASAPGMGDMASMLESVLNSIPEIIEKTSVVEIGINLQHLSSNSVPMLPAD